jgi:hypothetical protein
MASRDGRTDVEEPIEADHQQPGAEPDERRND